MLPMRDGVELHTLVVTPLIGTNFTTVFDTSPYGEDGIELIDDATLLLGYAAVTQDVRGTCLSNGSFELFHVQPQDGYDTLAWIAEQAWSNGEVYTLGASADAISSMMMLNAEPRTPPALKKQFAALVTATAYATFFPGGALRKSLAEFWIRSQSYAHGDADAERLLQATYAREAPGGANAAWWDAVTLHADRVAGPAVFWGGWYDIFQQGTLDAFDVFNYRTAPSSAAHGRSWLFVDPCGHCQSAAARFPQHDIAGRAVLPLLLAIKLFAAPAGAGIAPGDVPEGVERITFYVLGADPGDAECTRDAAACGNYFTSLAAWPPYEAKPFRLCGGGALSAAHAPCADPLDASTSFVYDPRDPAPTVGGDNLEIPCGPLDQRAVDARPDVLTFTSAPLAEAAAITGPIAATLWVSTRDADGGARANDTDFVVKLSDVGRGSNATATLLKDGVVRMMWRERGDARSNGAPRPIAQGAVYEVRVGLRNTSYVFAKGHRIRVSVSSSNYPRISLNGNNGYSLADLHSGSGHNASSRFVAVRNTVHHGVLRPSRIDLPLVPLSALPPVAILDAERALARGILADRRAAPKAAAAPPLGVSDAEVERFLAGLRRWGDAAAAAL